MSETYASKIPGSELPFTSIRNARDLGGYETPDGKHVKYGLLFRGPVLNSLSDEDLDYLDSMKIRTLLDLRSKTEADSHSELVPEGCSYYRECASIDRYGNEIDFSPGAIKKLSHKFITLFRLIRGMVNNDIYDCMPFSNPAFRLMFSLLEKQEVPMYIHCAAGKDRTGVAAILILMALGVDEETALDDYELTNVYYADRIERSLQKRRLLIKMSKTLKVRFAANEGVSRPVAKHTVSLIFERYGTFENYLLKEYGIDDERQNRLKQMYLE